VELAIEGDAAFTVVIAHGDPEVRSRLAEALDADEELEVIAGTPSGEEALDIILEELPDLVVVGEDLADRSGREVVRRIHHDLPICTVVAVLHGHDNAYDLLTAGAMSCLLIDEVDDPVEVVRGAARAESVITAAWAARMVDDIAALRGSTTSRPDGLELSKTEEEVLERLARGETPEAIAEHHDVTGRLVNLHTGYAVSKLHWAFDEQTRIEALHTGVG
jgi:DNA-binding NarL/FixJ family response regulator